MKFTFAAIIITVAIGIVGYLVWLLNQPIQAKKSRSSPKPVREPKPPSVPPLEGLENDDGVTILSFKPIVLDDEPTNEWTDSGVKSDADFGTIRSVLHDAGAADDEPSAAVRLLLVSAVGNTHRGRRRKHNEDSFLVLESQHLFVVADGMGGYAGGEVASRIAVETMERAFVDNHFVGGTNPETAKDGAQLAASVHMANRAIWNEAVANPTLAGMGTTLCAARFSPRKERVYLAHVGDSRCYRFRDGKLSQVTRDHTLKEEGVKGPMGHQLTRAVGIGAAVEVDMILVEPKLRDLYLLCSDGLTKMVPDAEIEEILRSCSTASVAVEALVNRANQMGGKDNITVIVVTIESALEDVAVVDDGLKTDNVPAELSQDEIPTVDGDLPYEEEMTVDDPPRAVGDVGEVDEHAAEADESTNDPTDEKG